MKLLPFAFALAAAASAIVAGGCAHLASGDVPIGPTPTPTPSATPSGAPCVSAPASNAQIVAISPLITPTIDPVYGLIGGYGLVSGGNSSNVAAPIVVNPPAVVQFFDNDQIGSQLRYSAVGIPGVTAFPTPSYTFPPALATQTGTAISTTLAWSTGLLTGQCYSQSFTVNAPGVYYFGDYTYYGLGNVRDVIVATASPSN